MTRTEMLIAALTELDRHIEEMRPPPAMHAEISVERVKIIDAILAERDAPVTMATAYTAPITVSTPTTEVEICCLTCVRGPQMCGRVHLKCTAWEAK